MKKLNKTLKALLLLTGAFIISMILGAVSCSIHDVITASYFYLVWPVLIFLVSLVFYAIIRLASKNESLVFAFILSIGNVLINTILLIILISY